ncbi:DMT family transporter [Shimia sp. CNT1-13L.2]|uniref:DMT family transporter n=1 Tax=Shimia sp. CNT1-13L.2 TaxID=2959663 RepID=UPI0020CF4AD9|nr:DMT family transporter [Shimia sp. CNT1-13L.2]MCP9480829.1 DMT family transporter [Shimia sp. CNT1-13L.2]
MSMTNPGSARVQTAGASSVFSGNALGVASMFTWACGFPAAEILLENWPPLALIAARFALAVTLLVPVWILMDGPRAVVSARWGKGAIIGGLTFGAGAYLLLLAQALTDPVTVAIIASTSPISAALIEVISRTRKINRAFLVGLAASVVGGIVATANGDLGDIGIGAAAVVVSCTLFAIGSHATVTAFPTLSQIGRTTITLAGGLMFNAVALLATHAAGFDVLPKGVVDGTQMGLMAIYAIAGMALSQLMWIATVGRLGVAVASFHINVAPFYVMLLMLGLGATWDWQQAAGAAIVIAGVVVAQKRPRR